MQSLKLECGHCLFHSNTLLYKQPQQAAFTMWASCKQANSAKRLQVSWDGVWPPRCRSAALLHADPSEYAPPPPGFRRGKFVAHLPLPVPLYAQLLHQVFYSPVKQPFTPFIVFIVCSPFVIFLCLILSFSCVCCASVPPSCRFILLCLEPPGM